MRKEILITFTLFSVFLSAFIIGANSTSSEFSVTPNNLRLNWTNDYSDTFTIQNLNDTRDIRVNILNSSAQIKHYKQYSVYPKTIVNNKYINESVLVNNSSSNTTTIEINATSLHPGRYSGSIIFFNSTNQEENTTVNITLDFPLNLSSGHDNFEGNITNCTENIFYFNNTQLGNSAGIKVNITDISSKVNLYLYDSSGNQKNTTTTNGTQELNYVFNSFPTQTGYWYIRIFNNSITSPLIYNGTLQLLKPNLRINTTDYPNGTFDSNPSDQKENIMFTENVGFNKTTTERIFIKNFADQSLNYVVTDSSFLNRSSSYIIFTHNLTNGTITANSNKTIEINITLDTSKMSHSGLYKGWILINSTNGYPYKKFNLTLVANMSSRVDLVTTDVKTSDGDNDMEDPDNSEEITVFSKVFLLNGTEITDFNISDFYLDLRHKNKTNTISFSSLSNYTTTLYNNGKYKINATVPSGQIGGYYSVNLSLVDSRAGATLRGSSTNGTLSIQETALWLEADDTDFTIDEEDTDTFRLTVTNYGPTTATGKIELEEDCTGFSIETEDFESGCGSVEENSGSSPGFDVDISEGESCWYEWTLVAGIVSSDKSCDLDLDVEDKHFNSIDVDVDIEDTGSTTAGASSTGTSTTTTSTISASQDTEIKIKSYPATLEVIQGDTEEFNIIVKNIGDTDQDNLKLYITGASSEWFSYKPSKLYLEEDDEGTFDVTFNPPTGADINEYEINFTVKNSYADTSRSSRFKVLPTASEKLKINNTYKEYKTNYTQMKSRVDELGKTIDVSELNETLTQLKESLNKADEEINKDNYIEARKHLAESEFLLSLADEKFDEISSLEKYAGGGISKIIWIIIGVIAIVIIGFVIYLSLPPKEEYRLKGRTPKNIKYKAPSSYKDIPKKILNFLKDIFQKIFSLFSRK